MFSLTRNFSLFTLKQAFDDVKVDSIQRLGSHKNIIASYRFALLFINVL